MPIVLCQNLRSVKTFHQSKNFLYIGSIKIQKTMNEELQLKAEAALKDSRQIRKDMHDNRADMFSIIMEILKKHDNFINLKTEMGDDWDDYAPWVNIDLGDFKHICAQGEYIATRQTYYGTESFFVGTTEGTITEDEMTYLDIAEVFFALTAFVENFTTKNIMR